MVDYTPSPNTKKSLRKRDMAALLIFIVIALSFYLMFALTVVKGRSMEPTLIDGQLIIIGKCRPFFNRSTLNRGDVIVFTMDGETLVKRVGFIGGDKTPDGRILPKGFLYVVGDNPPMSEDSRAFGPIAITQVIGRVLKAKPL